MERDRHNAEWMIEGFAGMGKGKKTRRFRSPPIGVMAVTAVLFLVGCGIPVPEGLKQGEGVSL
jgi:hypothetical protein